jgi:hypothetical protein
MTKLSFRIGLILIAVGSVSITLAAHALGPLTNQQLAAARAGTAAYHDVSVALADGYIPLGFNPDEGIFEFVNFALLDCTFDPSHPEGLAYVASGHGLRLVAVEYAVPYACTSPGVPPEGFAGDDDIWGQEGDLPVWRLGAMIWAGREQGPFDPAGGDDSSVR